MVQSVVESIRTIRLITALRVGPKPNSKMLQRVFKFKISTEETALFRTLIKVRPN